MIGPAIPRWFADTLADPMKGVNALSPLVPRAVGDEAPPAIAIHSIADDAWVARNAPVEDVSPDLWILRVGALPDAELAGNPNEEGSLVDGVSVVLLLEGVTRDSRDDVAAAHATRIVRAIRKCLLSAFRDRRSLDNPALVLDGHHVQLPARMGVTVQPPAPGSGTIAIAIELSLLLTDTWALSATEN